jgi:hypothetical protein
VKLLVVEDAHRGQNSAADRLMASACWLGHR